MQANADEEPAVEAGDLGHSLEIALDQEPAKPLISPEVAMASAFARPIGRRQRIASSLDPGALLHLFQKLARVEHHLSEIIQGVREGWGNPLMKDAGEQLGRALMLGDLRFIMSVIDTTGDTTAEYTTDMEKVTFGRGHAPNGAVSQNVSRFLQFIAGHKIEVEASKGAPPSVV
jgi:hypothetical protein